MKTNYPISGIGGLLLLFGSPNIDAQCTATTVPYYEGFQNITLTNQLPNCWAASNASVTCLTFTTPSKYAAFYYNPGGVNYFYSEGLQLTAGVSYSAALFYKTDNSGSLNWTDLSILFGTSQTPGGLTSIASTGGPASSPNYNLLSNVFTVPVSGVYYIVIRGTGTNTASSQYLYWDDLSVTIPCGIGFPNTPTLSLSPNSATICANQDSVTFFSTGSGTHTLLWNTGATTPSIIVSPWSTANYFVTVTNTLSGCSRTYSCQVKVNPASALYVDIKPKYCCPGESMTVTAYDSANIITWSNGATGTVVVVTPTASSTFTATKTTTAGCVVTATINITLHPLPSITANATKGTICKNDSTYLIGGGGAVYIWMPTGFGPTITVSPVTNSSYTVIGTDGYGCTNTATVEVKVISCTGINSLATIKEKIEIYPNPTSRNCIIKLPQLETGSLRIFDVFGKMVLMKSINNEEEEIDLQDLAQGFYFFTIETMGHFEVKKVIKE